jgi:hypothetical protein
LWVPLGICAIVLAVGIFLPAEGIMWVGDTDLMIEFTVTDASTGLPVNDVVLLIHPDGGPGQPDEEKDFTLRTGQDGIARRMCHAMCFGTHMRWCRITTKDTFLVHVPWWEVQASAPGYEPREKLYLGAEEFHHKVERLPGDKARLVVPVELHRLQPPDDPQGNIGPARR